MTSLSPVALTAPTTSAITSFQEPTYGASVFAKASEEQILEATKDRSVLLLLINSDNQTAILTTSPPNVLFSTFFRNLVIERKSQELEQFNPLGIPLDPDQYVVIVRDTSLSTGAMLTLSMNDSFSLKLKTLVALQLLDKQQSYNTLSSDLRWLLSIFLQSLAHNNTLFWKGARDKFPELFSIRRFRLEVKGVEKAEAKLEGSSFPLKGKKDLTLGDYAHLSEQDRKYADAYDEKFKAFSPESYNQLMTKEELMFIARWLRSLREYDMLIRLWCILASSFELYHYALDPEFQQLVDQVDSMGIMGQFVRQMIYMMYKEECNIREQSTTEMRHVMSLSQLEKLKWLLCPIELNATQGWPSVSLLPIPKSQRESTSWGPHNAHIFGFISSPAEYKQRLGSLCYNIFDDLKVPGIYVTGGISCACLIKSDVEMKRVLRLNAGYLDPNNYTAYIPPGGKQIPTGVRFGETLNPGPSRNLLLSLLGLDSDLYPRDVEDNKRNPFNAVIKDLYADADIDIAIQAKDREEFKSKLDALEAHIRDKTNPPGGGGPSSVRKMEDVKFEPHAVSEKSERYRMKLKNGTILEAFYITVSPLAMIFNFHVPPVRHYYDVSKQEVFILPSCLWAAWTGNCVDIKYFASSRDPREIIYKYTRRGFNFILNRYENQSYHDFARSEEGQILAKKYAASFSVVDFRSINAFRSAIRLFLMRNRKGGTKYFNSMLWKLKAAKDGVKEYVVPWDYPENVFGKKTNLELDEGPNYEEEKLARPWEEKYVLIKREGGAILPVAAGGGFVMSPAAVPQMQLAGGLVPLTAAQVQNLPLFTI